jgi:hypothetical protein
LKLLRLYILSTELAGALGPRGGNRETAESDDTYVLRETEENHGPVFGVENRLIRSKNVHFCDGFCLKTVTWLGPTPGRDPS